MINLNKNPYILTKDKKSSYILKSQKKLIFHHNSNSKEYKKIVNIKNISKIKELNNLPFVSINLFKELNLSSIKKKYQFKILTSSGTSGKLSTITLDKQTASFQKEALITITKNFLGKDRMPMLVVDNEEILKNKKSFSARAAAILGFSIFGSDRHFVLDNKFEINYKKLNDFLLKYKNQNILIFGFTYLIWKYLIKVLEEKKLNLNLNNSLLLHSGGWKKLSDISVNNDFFKSSIKKFLGIKKVHNYYGMVEQVGSIFVECEEGYLHPPIFSDIIIRDKISLKQIGINKVGIIQVVSCLPKSYPGHSLLTEDLGIIHGIDNCKCGRKGKYFSIKRRLKKSELRGCSDTQS